MTDDSTLASRHAVTVANTSRPDVEESDPRSTSADGDGSRLHDPLTRFADGIVNGAVVLFAIWTVVYHLCLVTRLDVRWAAALEVAAVVGVAVGLLRHQARRRRGISVAPTRPDQAPRDVVQQAGGDQAIGQSGEDEAWGGRLGRRALVAGTLGGTLLASLAAAWELPWTLVAVGWLVAGVSGIARAFVTLGSRPATTPRHGRVEAGVALLLAIAAAVLSLWILRPNPDDIYYVNLSQFVADSGSFPLKDTIFANLEYPMSSWPPMASYDGLLGAIAHLLHIRAAPLVYIVAPAITSFLAVLALWQLLRAWRVQIGWLALSSGLLFLILDGIAKHGPGNLFVSRLFQAKVAFLCVMIPVLLVAGLRYVERPSRARAGWLFVTGVAAVGVTTSAMFLTPLVALACAAPLVPRRPKQALVGFAAMASYPLAAGFVTKVVGGRSADDFDHKPVRFDASWFGPEVFHHGTIAVIGMSAVLLGTLLVPHRAARVMVGVAALPVGISYLPGVTHLSFDLIGLGPTLWRLSWLLTVAALVGVAVVWMVERVPDGRPRLVAAALAPVLLTGLLVTVSEPIWGGATAATLDPPFHLQRSDQTIEMANKVIKGAAPGELVLAPEPLSITISVLTTKIHTVAPRKYFLDYLRDEPGFHYDERIELSDFAQRVNPWDKDTVLEDLRVVGVDMVCLESRGEHRILALKSAGYRTVYATDEYRCLKRR